MCAKHYKGFTKQQKHEKKIVFIHSGLTPDFNGYRIVTSDQSTEHQSKTLAFRQIRYLPSGGKFVKGINEPKKKIKRSCKNNN